MTALFQTLVLFIIVGTIFFLPGWLFLRFIVRENIFTPFESLTTSFALGLGAVDFLMILLGKSHILLNHWSLGIGLVILVTTLLLFVRSSRKQKNAPALSSAFPFSQKQTWLFILLFVLTLLIKTIYLSHAILPTATDLGHHMYWSKLIAETGKLPFYAKQDIVTDATGHYQLSAPTPIADFIIGEHLPFAAINIFSGLDFLSAFPILFLLAINLLALLALYVLIRALATDLTLPTVNSKIFTPQNIALLTLFFCGPLYTLASPQAKFVSGGVVGNTIGNLFVPLILLFFFRALKEKRSDILTVGLILLFTLAYTHHLSTLMVLFALFATALLHLLFHHSEIPATLRSWFDLVAKPKPLIFLGCAFSFFLVVAMPTYIETHAVGTALGTPTKATRTGLTFSQISFSSGEARVALGLVAFFLLGLSSLRRTYQGTFLLGWGVILFVMTFRPSLLFINIPSNRIGAYLSFPLGLLAAFTLLTLASLVSTHAKKFALPSFLACLVLGSAVIFALGSGSYDNSQTILPESKALSALETFHVSQYLALHNTPSDLILKDHNYLAADSWMKLFFLRDYFYPLSRGFFKRYEDNPDREQCTLSMIATPNTARGEKCFTDTGTNLVIVNPHYDATPFEKSKSFSRIYTSDDIQVYLRP